jgi:hypothetical protein
MAKLDISPIGQRALAKISQPTSPTSNEQRVVRRDRPVQPFIKLRETKQLRETAVCESIHGGVRGRGINPPTYSICITKYG